MTGYTPNTVSNLIAIHGWVYTGWRARGGKHQPRPAIPAKKVADYQTLRISKRCSAKEALELLDIPWTIL